MSAHQKRRSKGCRTLRRATLRMSNFCASPYPETPLRVSLRRRAFHCRRKHLNQKPLRPTDFASHPPEDHPFFTDSSASFAPPPRPRQRLTQFLLLPIAPTSALGHCVQSRLSSELQLGWLVLGFADGGCLPTRWHVAPTKLAQHANDHKKSIASRLFRRLFPWRKETSPSPGKVHIFRNMLQKSYQPRKPLGMKLGFSFVAKKP